MLSHVSPPVDALRVSCKLTTPPLTFAKLLLNRGTEDRIRHCGKVDQEQVHLLWWGGNVVESVERFSVVEAVHANWDGGELVLIVVRTRG